MHEIKNKYKGISYGVTFVLFFIGQISLLAQGSIIGPSNIFPNVLTDYSRSEPVFLEEQGPWKCDDANVTLSDIGSGLGVNGSDIGVTISPNETNCNFTLYWIQKLFEQNQDGGIDLVSTNTITKTISVLPKIVIPPVIAGQTIYLSIQDNCQHTGCSYLWSVSTYPNTINICPTCGSTGTNMQAIYIDPTQPLPTSINVNCTISDCLSPTLSSTALQSAGALVQLHTPSISGPDSVGCNLTTPVGNFVYTASSYLDGATYWLWSVPTFITIISGQGTKILTVDENSAPDSGIITVTAYNLDPTDPANSPKNLVHSAQVSHSINICCRSQANLVNEITAPIDDHKQAAIDIIASNTIDNGASAKYHAGLNVYLEPGFDAKLGSNFHGYIQGCSDDYQRISNSINQNNINAVTNGLTINQSIEPDKNSLTNSISIYPNPSSGVFSIEIKNSISATIDVYDAIGNRIQSIGNSNKVNNIDLSSYEKGIYMISITIDGKQKVNKKVILQ